RPTAAEGLVTARTMSAGQLTTNAVSLASVKNAYDSSIAVLSGPNNTGFNPTAVATAYGLPGTTRAVTSFASQMMAAELMVMSGTNVVCAMSNAGWDTHGDTTGATVRNRMNASIL